MIKALVIYGSGIGCHREVQQAYTVAGAEATLVHIKDLVDNMSIIDQAQIINFTGGFLFGDLLGSGMCAANELDLASSAGLSLKSKLIKFAQSKRVIYGQCNGFQLLVKLGLLPGVDGDYSQQNLTLAHNVGGVYRVDFVSHLLEGQHFAFAGMEGQTFHLWCRHGEGKITFSDEYGLVKQDQANINRLKVNQSHVLLRYANYDGSAALDFPENPNGSVDAIAGLKDSTGYIFGHMAHPEVSVYSSRAAGWYQYKDSLRRKGRDRSEYDHTDLGAMIFNNIVSVFN